MLGKLEFEGRPLRELLLDAIRYGEQPEVRARLDTAVDQALDRASLQDLLEERQLVHDAMDASRVQRVREEMERAEARRLQPHYIESFFREAFRQLGGSARQREPRRYQVAHVPALIRNRDRLIGTSEPVLPRYERIVFEKPLVAPPGQPLAAFVCPGHPLLDAVIDLILERHRDLLKRGAVLVDERDHGTTPRVLFSIEHALQDAGVTRAGDRRVVSKRVLYVELDNDGVTRHLHYAPYLDYRPLADDEPAVDAFLERPECSWIDRDLEQTAQAYAVADVVPEHLAEVRAARLALTDKTEAPVEGPPHQGDLVLGPPRRAARARRKDRQDRCAPQLGRGASAGGHLAGPVAEADRGAKSATRRYRRGPPVVLVGLLVVPQGLVDKMTGRPEPNVVRPDDTLAVAARARDIVMETERGLGFEPTDRELDKLGYDIESRDPATGKLRFIEVKGRRSDASSRGNMPAFAAAAPREPRACATAGGRFQHRRGAC